jgi:beta-glucanase (GH16 family)
MKNTLYTPALIVLSLMAFTACNKASGSSEKSDILISKSVYAVVEDATGSSVDLPVFLSGAIDEVVTVSYSTQDSTAVAGKNYVAVPSGTLTFNPGETTKSINIAIMHDTALKQDVYFKVLFSNPVNAAMKYSSMTVKVANVDYATLTWSDEFNDADLNTAWWNYEQGNNNGWGNNELEVYTNKKENVHLDSGYLHITALSPVANYYSSGRITTQGKKEFTYGKIMIRAKLPQGQGIWPALWMLGGNISEVSWPKCGEIDIMEFLGHQTNKVYGTLHWDENGHQYTGGNTTLSTGTFSNDFHIFTLEWTPGRFTWFVDGQQYFELDRQAVSKFPFDLPEFFIFNVAVGGNWPGPPDETTVFPQHMIVDYIRIYQ